MNSATLLEESKAAHLVMEGQSLSGLPKPPWLSISPPSTTQYTVLKKLISTMKLVTVCQEAHCPNMAECWSKGTATFMILGDACTRGCRFCHVATRSRGRPLDPEEPKRIVEAVRDMGLRYAVITSVDRDDLSDQGAGHFATCIKLLKESNHQLIIESLIPDFQGRRDLIQKVIDAKPNVISHNIETVERLQKQVRDSRASYHQSLSVLSIVKHQSPSIITKTSLMLGFGETKQEVFTTMDDLRSNQVDILTLGQYLRPSPKHAPVTEYVHPDAFEMYKQIALEKGFRYCAAGPFVRSSYRAGELFVEHNLHIEHNFQETKQQEAK